MTWLGALNFLVLQWFGVRLARWNGLRLLDVQADRVVVAAGGIKPGGAMSVGYTVGRTQPIGGWKLLRWVWPLTGWWNDYRWIARRR